jgi:predicted ester cyclase
MSADDNAATMQRYREQVHADGGDFSGIFTDDFVDHDPADGQPDGGEGLGWYWSGFRRAFPDYGLERLETVVTDDHVVSVATLTGTHRGEYLGQAPTGRTIAVRMVQVMKFRDGLISERWGSTDQLGIVQQLRD